MSSPHRRFCLTCLALTSTAFLALAVFNYLVNPYAQYEPQLIPPMVQPSRSTKLRLVEQMTPPPTGLILGSSRVLKLEAEYLNRKTGLRFFNAGVNFGKPEDYLAFFRHHIETFQVAPQMVVLGVDIVAFSNGTPTDARLLGNASLARQVPDIIPLEDRFHRWKELLSWQQTVMSAKSLMREWRQQTEPPPVESFRDDGVIVYHEREQQLQAGTYDFAAALAYNQGEYRQLYGSFEDVSLKRAEAFYKLMKLCRDHHTKLIVFLTPMHPDLQSHLADTVYEQRRQRVQTFFRRLASGDGFTFVDLSDLASFAGSAELFVDGVHPLEPNTRKMIDRCLWVAGLTQLAGWERARDVVQ